jgi:hypothetical protein
MSIVLLSALAFGQQQQQQQQAAQKEPEFVNHKEFKTKIIELKNRNPLELVSVLSALGSGFKGAKVSGNTEFKTITVRDFPENIVIIEDALKRLDVPKPPKPPEPPKRDIEITAYILIASNQEAAASQYPAPLRDVVTQLQKTLGFKNYQLLTPIVQRTSAYSGSLSNQGTAVFPGEAFAARYELQISRIGPENWEKPDSNVVFVGLTLSLRGNSNDDFRQIGEAKISTNLNVKENEKMVVGTSSMKDKGLILVVIAKYMN